MSFPIKMLSSTRCNRNATTLIEVVAGIALLGTLLTGILVGGSQCLRQMRAAERKYEATQLLSRFVSKWATLEYQLEDVAKIADEVGLFFGSRQRDHVQDDSSYELEIRNVRSEFNQNAAVLRISVSRPSAPKTDAWLELLVSQ